MRNRHFPTSLEKIIIFPFSIVVKLKIIKLKTLCKIILYFGYNYAFIVRILEDFFNFQNRDAMIYIRDEFGLR